MAIERKFDNANIPAGAANDAVPPSGYKRLNKVTPEIAGIAKSLLNKGTFGDVTPFTSNDGTNYIARVEHHFHTMEEGPPYGWHKGITVYVSDSTLKESKSPTKQTATEEASSKPISSTPAGRMQLLQRIINFLDSFNV